MNILEAMRIMSAAMPIILDFEDLKNAKTAKTRKSALKDLTAQVMGVVDDLTPLKITDRKKFAADTLELETPVK